MIRRAAASIATALASSGQATSIFFEIDTLIHVDGTKRSADFEYQVETRRGITRVNEQTLKWLP
jgi:hypothetical protein